MRHAVLPHLGGPGHCLRGSLVIAIVACLVQVSGTASAQPPGGRIPPGQKNAAGKKKDAGKPATPAPITPLPKTEEPVDEKTGLPKTWKPPADKNGLAELDSPLLPQEKLDELKKSLGTYRTKLRNGDLNDAAGKEIIRKGIQYRLALLCEKKNRQTLHNLREDLTIRDFQGAGALLSKPQDIAEFRKWVFGETLKLLEPLFENNLYVRIQAATLLGELDLTEESANKGTKQEAFTPSASLLAKVLENPDQPPPVKIAAARSIVRLFRFGNPSVALKHEVATKVLNELRDEKTHFWYQMRLVEVLSLIDVSLDLANRKPFIVDGLRAALVDERRDWRVRSASAKALGRVPLDAQVDVPGLMRDIAKLSYDMAKEARKDAKNPIWETTFWWVYLAFQPESSDEKDATRKLAAGLRKNPASASLCEPVYQMIPPIMNKLIAKETVGVEQVKALEDWLAKNPPSKASNTAGTPKSPTAAGQAVTAP